MKSAFVSSARFQYPDMMLGPFTAISPTSPIGRGAPVSTFRIVASTLGRGRPILPLRDCSVSGLQDRQVVAPYRYRLESRRFSVRGLCLHFLHEMQAGVSTQLFER